MEKTPCVTADSIVWDIKPFDRLSLYELYDILRLRAEVFVVEQDCVYQDLDGIDLRSFHLTGRTPEGELACIMRIIPEGAEYTGRGSIGRIIVAKKFRGLGLGHRLLRRGLEAYGEIVGSVPIEIAAQAYLRDFYTGYGFVAQGDVFIMDGLPHIKMLRP